MATVKIQPLDNAPYLVSGEIELLDGEGKKIVTTTETHLCRCGLSTNQPFCTGAHDGKFENKVRSK
jgi:CDGSH-type Zn-finger protein